MPDGFMGEQMQKCKNARMLCNMCTKTSRNPEIKMWVQSVIQNNNPKHRKQREGENIVWKVQRAPDQIVRKLCRTSGKVLTDISREWVKMGKLGTEMSGRIEGQCYSITESIHKICSKQVSISFIRQYYIALQNGAADVQRDIPIARCCFCLFVCLLLPNNI